MPKPLSVLVEAISGKRSATDGEPDGQKGRRKHIKQQPGGTKDDVTMGGTSSGQKGSAKGASKSTGREATQRRPQDALRALSASEGGQRRSLHVLDDQARGARVQETERAIARLLGTGGDQGQGTRPRSARDSGFHGLVASAVGERQQAQWERQTRLEWQTSSQRGTIWNQRELSIWYLIASWPKCTTQL